MKKNFLLNIIGWYGVLAILVAYALLSFSFIASTSLWYQLLNLSGALGIVIETSSKKDYQPLALNLIWVAIALIAIIHAF